MFAACLAGIGVVMVAYLCGWYVVRRAAGGRLIVWSFALLFAGTLFWLMPVTSDLFGYLGGAHLLTDLGLNPLQVAPLDVPGDRLLESYPTPYAASPAVYGPAWALMAAPAALSKYDVAGGMFYLKALAAAAYLLCAWLLEQILRTRRAVPRGRSPGGHSSSPRLGPSVVEGLYMFAWNPLVLLMAVGDGHNDIVMMAAVLMAFWLALQGQWTLTFASLTLSVWIKYVSIIYLPLFALGVWKGAGRWHRHRSWPNLLSSMMVMGGISLLFFMPFGSVEWVPGMVDRLLRPANWQLDAGNTPARLMMVGLAVFVIVYLILMQRLAHGAVGLRRLMDAGFLVSLMAFFFGVARSQPWHLIWPAALAGLSERRWAGPVVAGLSFVMLAVQVWVEWGVPGLGTMLS